MFSRTKITQTDRVYIWTFIITLVVFIYYTFKSYYIGELSRYLGIEFTDSSEGIKSYSRLVLTITSLLFFYRKNSIKHLSFMGKTLLVFSLYILSSIILQKNFTNPMYYISTYTMSSVWIYSYVFFYTIRLRYNIDRFIPKFIIVFTIISAILFIHNYLMNNAIGHTDWHYIESYFLITLLPALILLNNKYKYPLILLVIICAIISGKRSGFITCATSIALYMMMTGRNLSNRIQKILYGTVLVFLLYFILNQFIGDQIYFLMERIANTQEDDGSGRGEVYANLYNLIINNQDIISLFFGNGYNEVINSQISNGFSAHNEFLEVTYDFGILGFLIFLTIFVAIYRLYAKTKVKKQRVALFISFVIFLIFSLTSHTILYTTNIVFLCMIWGYFDAKSITRK